MSPPRRSAERLCLTPRISVSPHDSVCSPNAQHLGVELSSGVGLWHVWRPETGVGRGANPTGLVSPGKGDSGTQSQKHTAANNAETLRKKACGLIRAAGSRGLPGGRPALAARKDRGCPHGHRGARPRGHLDCRAVCASASLCYFKPLALGRDLSIL